MPRANGGAQEKNKGQSGTMIPRGKMAESGSSQTPTIGIKNSSATKNPNRRNMKNTVMTKIRVAITTDKRVDRI